MYNATVTYLNSYEYFEIDKFDNEYHGNVLRESFCPMCEIYHQNNSECQRGDE